MEGAAEINREHPPYYEIYSPGNNHDTGIEKFAKKRHLL